MRRGVWICGVLICLLLPACSSNKPPTPTQNFVAWSTQTPQHKKQLCVLPFENTSRIDGLAEKVRQGVAGHLSIKRFTDTELHEIDATLAGLDHWHKLASHELGRKLNCDALVYGRVSKPNRVYLVVYSQLALEGTLQIVESATGRTLVHETYTTRLHDAGLPFSPISLATSAARTLRTFTDAQLVRAIDDLSRNLAARVPDLPKTGQRARGMPQKEYLEPPFSPSYRIQVAAFRSHDEAQYAARLLRREGYAPAIAEVTEREQAWHRVIIGPFSSARSARETGVQIREKLPFDPIVIQGPSR